MTPEEFRQTLSNPDPPPGLSSPGAALWWAAKGDWERAHRIVMDDDSPQAAWVHAYLHRAEGDLSNARYWYRQANRPASTAELPAEWEEIVGAML